MPIWTSPTPAPLAGRSLMCPELTRGTGASHCTCPFFKSPKAGIVMKSGNTSQIHGAGRQSRGHRGQFAERAGGGLQACSSSKKLRGLIARAHVRRCAYKHFSLVLCCEGCLYPASLTQRDEAQRIEVQYQGHDKRALCHPSSIPIQFTVSNTFTPRDSRPCS